jgi:transposase-like protein
MQSRWRENWVKWRELIAEQSGSGRTIAAFCRERGLTTSQFFAWKKRLRQGIAEQFVEVQVGTAPAQLPKANGRAIEVLLSEGRRILVQPGFDAEHLRAVVAALETRG